MAKPEKVNGVFVLDASVVIKWFSEEEYTDRALKLRDDFSKGDIELVVPDLILYEVSNALRYNPDFDETDVADAVGTLFDIGISIIVPNREVINSALNLAYEHKITVYDAYYVALAKEINFKLITADRKLYLKIKDLKFAKYIDEI
ncbi:MAG: type II toxin-antitoxin system VapC family toxin [Euryarchaeota archaeon]|nr:type II toxin-antitoxin system VapC family toxin [Euryarchaeota archaeon]MCG2736422.1 type II toxin-antitoxin system VapC family toxin [Candidatus Methanoperedenaceae archaeon]